MRKLRAKISVVLMAILMLTAMPAAAFGESYIALNKDSDDIYDVVIGNDYTIPAAENDILLIDFYTDSDLLNKTTIASVESSDPTRAEAACYENDSDLDPNEIIVYIEEGFDGADITVTDYADKVSIIEIEPSEDSDTEEDELSTPTLTAKAIASTKVKLTWDTDDYATGYKIYRAAKKSGTYKLIKTIKSNSTSKFTNTKLKTGKRYYYKIRSYRTVSGKTEYSSYSSVKSAMPKKNVLVMCESDDYNIYGGVRIAKMKVSYNSKNRLVVKVNFYNNRRFRATKFSWILLKVYDDKGKLVGTQKFRNVKLGIGPYDKKWVTFNFSAKATKQKKAYLGGMDPDIADYYYDYYYHYTY